jgi:hypothetical protein
MSFENAAQMLPAFRKPRPTKLAAGGNGSDQHHLARAMPNLCEPADRARPHSGRSVHTILLLIYSIIDCLATID